ncbi:unnamed protein product [Danaus chrysippus]|uniref:(African queen) hypothetical protein n=1 Tax=Danaus chrysippus TaxID=151541 RepID=A0A8J2QC39_9NEOP|nr:unnamed protein product [Danaus chrysippus]
MGVLMEAGEEDSVAGETRRRRAGPGPARSRLGEDRVARPPKKKWIEEYLGESEDTRHSGGGLSYDSTHRREVYRHTHTHTHRHTYTHTYAVLLMLDG